MEHPKFSKSDIDEYETHMKYFQGDSTMNGNSTESRSEDVKASPLITWEAKIAESQEYPSYSLIGSFDKRQLNGDGNASTEFGAASPAFKSDRQVQPIYLNTNTPFSAFICGSQGSGKSHTLSCILENCLLQKPELGKLPNPMAGIVFHFDNQSDGAISEAAHLCSAGIKVQVLLCSNSTSRERAYKSIEPSERTGQETLDVVKRWRLNHSQLTVENMIDLMAFNEEGPMPLYMATVFRFLREIFDRPSALDTFSTKRYKLLRQKLRSANLAPPQLAMMEQRFEAMDSFLTDDPKEGFDSIGFKTEPGSLTVIDLTHPVIDASTACTIFRICLSHFLAHNTEYPKIVALDEAHKYMKNTSQSSKFTDSLLTAIRLQRHIAARIVIATQEPSVFPALLDLCNMTIVHRFTSPAWFLTLRTHLAGIALSEDHQGGSSNKESMLQKIVDLEVGESLLFAPTVRVVVDGKRSVKLGTRCMKMKTRARVSQDGGLSILATR